MNGDMVDAALTAGAVCTYAPAIESLVAMASVPGDFFLDMPMLMIELYKRRSYQHGKDSKPLLPTFAPMSAQPYLADLALLEEVPEMELFRIPASRPGLPTAPLPYVLALAYSPDATRSGLATNWMNNAFTLSSLEAHQRAGVFRTGIFVDNRAADHNEHSGVDPGAGQTNEAGGLRDAVGITGARHAGGAAGRPAADSDKGRDGGPKVRRADLQQARIAQCTSQYPRLRQAREEHHQV